MNYLFFFLTEEFIESHMGIAEILPPLLTQFASRLDGTASLIKPFRGYERSTLEDVMRRGFNDKQQRHIYNTIPALFVINVDYDDFDARLNNYLYISLRDSMDEFGNIKVFELKELLDELALGAKVNDLFTMATDYFSKKNQRSLAKAGWDVVELKPEIFGIALDLKRAVEFLKNLNQQNKNNLKLKP